MATDVVLDADGVEIPPFYQTQRKNWDRLPLQFRQERAAAHARREEEAANRREAGRGLPTFSTAYAKDECRKRNWRVIQSEYRDQRGNLHDCPFGADLVAMVGNRLIYIQAGCKGSHAEHRRRFDQRTEVLPMGARFLYWEFQRSGELVLEEEWRPPRRRCES